MSKVKVYTKKSCVQCTATKKQLRNLGVEFEEIKVDLKSEESKKALEFIKSLGYLSAPVVVATNGTTVHWSGFQPELLKALA